MSYHVQHYLLYLFIVCVVYCVCVSVCLSVCLSWGGRDRWLHWKEGPHSCWLPLHIPGTVATVQALSNNLGGLFAVDPMAVSMA